MKTVKYAIFSRILQYPWRNKEMQSFSAILSRITLKPPMQYLNIGEISIDLKSKQYSSYHKITGAFCLIIVEDFIYQRCTVISNNHLFEKSPQDLTHTIHGLLIVEHSFPLYLRQKMCCSFYRTCYKKRKIAYKNGIVCKASLSLYPFL